MAKILDTLHSDHDDMAKLLMGLERQIEIFEGGETPDYELMTNTLDYITRYPDRFHHPKEDLIHARLKRRAPDDDVIDLTTEHEELAALTRSVNAAIQDVLLDNFGPRAWISTVTRNFVTTYRHHMNVEERFFLPLAESKLTAEDWRELDAEAAALEGNGMDAADKKRFEALFAYVSTLQELDG